MIKDFFSTAPLAEDSAGDRSWVILQTKRRLYASGLLLVTASTLFSLGNSLLGGNNYPSLWAYLITNLVVLLTCGTSLVALRKLSNLRYVEILLVLISLLYLFYWDVAALCTHYLPSAEFLMTTEAVFVLTAAQLCLVVARQYMLLSLLTLFGLHELLNWVNLLQFPWSSVHSAQTMTDLLTAVTLLVLSLLGTYQYLIADSHRETAMMHLLAHTDPLTGLANRRSMYAQLQAAPHSAVLLIDIDDFKQVNDKLGHDAGDAVLKMVAATIEGAVGASGQVGRWGGEEFMVLLPQPTLQAGVAVAERVRQRIEESCTVEWPLTVSIGLSFPRDSEHLNLTLKRADELMYVAKNRGKNRVEYAPFH